MSKRSYLLATSSAAAIVCIAPNFAVAQTPGPASETELAEIIVTAEKRQENILDVGMSIQVASGEKLTKLGITDPTQLEKIVPGFVVAQNQYNTNVFTIRGVGFQDTSLAGSPTVSVYLDEEPLPFTSLTNGTTLDLERVEVLKGPQGTLFGENATGGAINYIAKKPTDSFEAGITLKYGRFNDADISGYASGPIADHLDVRLAWRTEQSGPWQKSYDTTQTNTIIDGLGPDPRYTPQPPSRTGGKDFSNVRFSVKWQPTDQLKALFTLSGWYDHGYSQIGQFYGLGSQSLSPLANALKHFPVAPHNDQAASFMTCVNTSPFDPIGGGGPNEGIDPATGQPALVYSGAQPTQCTAPRKNNNYFSGSNRLDYELLGDLTLTSLTEYQRFNRTEAIDGAGVNIQDLQDVQFGKIQSTYQELRLAGRINGKGSWILGGNYEYDKTLDRFLLTPNASSAGSAMIPRSALCGPGDLTPGCGNNGQPAVPIFFISNVGPVQPTNAQSTSTVAAYADAQYPVLDNVTLLGGVRFTQENKSFRGCSRDGGDGSYAKVTQQIQDLLEYLNGTTDLRTFLNATGGANAQPGGLGVNAGPFGCATNGPGPNFTPPAGGNDYNAKLDQNNVSWRTGLNWKVIPNALLYLNVSKGWKGGSFPTIASTSSVQLQPVVQESLLAYEAGFKAQLFGDQLQVTGAGFYYNYQNKQILGSIVDPVLGALSALVNVPQSHVVGFELASSWRPDTLKGLTIAPAVSYQDAQIDKSSKNQCVQPPAVGSCVPGHFYGFDDFGNYADFTGEHLPLVPMWQASIDAEYEWRIRGDMTAFVGANANYRSGTYSLFLDRTPPPGTFTDPLVVPGYTLIDLRAGVERDNWIFQVWGQNVTNVWYWTVADHVNDVLNRLTGMPVTYGVTYSYKFR